MLNEPVLTVEHLHHSYGSRQILTDINFTVNPGEFIALLGENGAGKTTLVKHFNGLLKPSSGRVMVGQMDTIKYKVSKLAQKVGFVFQNPDHQIFNSSVEKEVSSGLKYMKLSAGEINLRLDDALEATGLTKLRKSYPFDLSRGERQRIALASVLAVRPQVIVLDEPTTGLDYRESLQIMQLLSDLNQNGHTIIFITHNMSLAAEFAHRAIVLRDGKIIMDGNVREVFACPDVLAENFLELPPVNRMGMLLNYAGIKSDFLTVDEAFKALKPLVGSEDN